MLRAVISCKDKVMKNQVSENIPCKRGKGLCNAISGSLKDSVCDVQE